MSAHSEPSDEPPDKPPKLHTEVQRSPDFWFKRGDFVLVASHKVAYRIHADVLGHKSKVFSDLLDLDEVPRPEAEDTMDGCPVVHITDAPEDFSTFLGLVYNGFECTPPLGSLDLPLTAQHARYQRFRARWATVRTMLLLGDKYDVAGLREEGLRQLHTWYTDDIEEWDERHPGFFADDTDHLAVASITHTLGDPDLHAAVLYCCCALPVSQLVTGDPSTGRPPLCTDDLVDAIAYLKGRCSSYVGLLSDVFGDDLHDVFLACATCRVVWDTLLRSVDGCMKFGLEFCVSDPLDPSTWEPFSDIVKDKSCDNCFGHYTRRLQLVRQIYLYDLVERFALTSLRV